jgi:hypothetical protein
LFVGEKHLAYCWSGKEKSSIKLLSPRKYYLGDFFVSSLDIIKDEVVKTGLIR